MMILPRQTRDKHRENSKKETVLLQIAGDLGTGRTATAVYMKYFRHAGSTLNTSATHWSASEVEKLMQLVKRHVDGNPMMGTTTTAWSQNRRWSADTDVHLGSPFRQQSPHWYRQG